MQNALNPLAGVYQTQLEASRRLADAFFTGTQKIDSVMIGATHQLFTDQLNFVKELASARDPGSIGSALQSRMMSRNPGQATEYQRELVRIVVEMQSEIGQSMQDYVEQCRNQAVNGLKTPFAGTSSSGTTAATGNNATTNANPMASMFSVWENVFNDVATLAQRNMGAAAATANNMTQAATNAATNVADAATAAAATAASSTAPATASAPEVLVSAVDDATDTSGSDKKNYPTTGGKKK